MPQLNSLLDQFQPSAISQIFNLAGKLKEQGRDIIDLSIGEPDFPTPDHVKQAGIDAINQNKTQYTSVSGTTDLKRAIQGKFKRENGLDYSLSQIVVDSGVKPMLYHALQAIVEPGGEVIVPTPCWASYPGMVTLVHATAVFVPCLQRDGFKLQPGTLEAAITDKTCAIMLNSPNNPTGAAYSASEMKALTDVLLRHPHVWILTDDIYEHIVFDDFEFATPAQIEPRLYDRTITLNGASKAYSMTGWRIGYAGGPEAVINGIIKIMSQSNGNPNTISQIAAIAALEGEQDSLKEKAAIFKERRDYLLSRIKNIKGLSCHAPEGAFYLYPDCSGLLGLTTPDGTQIKTSADLAMYFLENIGVAIVPGSAFNYDPNIRISYATSMENITQACDRMELACKALK